VAYFIGEDAPKMTGVADPALPLGYQFDYINAEVILRDMTVKDGMLTLPHGTQYRVLVLPKLETMRPELLAKIKDLVAAGACILGPAPKRSPSLQNQPEADNQVKQMASELWGDIDGETVKERKFGKGVVTHHGGSFRKDCPSARLQIAGGELHPLRSPDNGRNRDLFPL